MTQRIDDHSFWAGGASKGSPFPEGAKVKEYSSANGAGELRKYEQTSDEIKMSQDMADKKIISHGTKEYYNN